MAAGFIQVAPDSTGKLLQTVHNTIGGNDVHAEAVLLVDQNGVVISSVPVTTSSTQRTCASSVVSASGSVTAGAQSVQFVPSSNFSGTLLGAAWPGTNAIIGLSVPGNNDTLAAIAYTITAGSLTILTIT